MRLAIARDSDAVATVLLESRRRFLPFAPSAHPDHEVRAWVRDTLVPAGGVVVCERDARIVAVLGTSEEPACSWIDQLSVLPGFTGQGLGTQLLRHAHRILRRPIRLFTFQENTGARRFYERHGYRAIAFSDGRENEELDRCTIPLDTPLRSEDHLSMSRKPSPRPASGPSDRGRWSSKRKTEVVLRLLRGEPLDEVSRDVGVTASRLTRWRDDFLAAGQSGLMTREADSRDEEIKSLKTKLGDQLMTIELLEGKIDQLEDGLRPPPARRKTRAGPCPPPRRSPTACSGSAASGGSHDPRPSGIEPSSRGSDRRRPTGGAARPRR